MLYLLIGFVVGFIVGKVYFTIKIKKQVSGKLKEASESGDHYLFLELKNSPTEIMRHKYAIFKVSTDDGTWIDAPRD